LNEDGEGGKIKERTNRSTVGPSWLEGWQKQCGGKRQGKRTKTGRRSGKLRNKRDGLKRVLCGLGDREREGNRE